MFCLIESVTTIQFKWSHDPFLNDGEIKYQKELFFISQPKVDRDIKALNKI